MLAAHASLDEYVVNWFGLDKSSGIQTLSIWPRYQLLTLVLLGCRLVLPLRYRYMRRFELAAYKSANINLFSQLICYDWKSIREEKHSN